jgi:hypothetical protein
MREPLEGGPVTRLAILIAAIALVAAPGTFGQDTAGTGKFTVNPAMSKGPVTAPVTIVEFSDYQ